MPRNMSFALTTQQIRDRTKTVTRRFGWWNLKPGQIINAVEKSMGIKKGEKINVLCQIRIVSTRQEPLSDMADEDCAREGFPHFKDKWEFIAMLIEHYNLDHANVPVNRIEFEYI